MSLPKFSTQILLSRSLGLLCQGHPRNLGNKNWYTFIVNFQGRQLKLIQETNQVRCIHSGSNVCSHHLSDPENKGKRQRGVNFDTLGSWNNRLDFSISLEKSIEKGKLIPEIPQGRFCHRSQNHIGLLWISEGTGVKFPSICCTPYHIIYTT